MQSTKPSHPAAHRKPFNRMRSLTRLAVGGVILGWEQFWQRLEDWESMMEAAPGEGSSAGAVASQNLPPESAVPNATTLPVYTTASQIIRERSSKDTLRLAAVGLVFQTEDRLREHVFKGKRLLRSTQNLIMSITEPVLGPAESRPPSFPFQKRFNRLVRRGEMELASWIKTGEEQELQSRQLARTAWKDTTEDSIDFLASNPSVQELVQTQSTGLAAEVIEEVRERTVSADTFLEGFARNILRKAPRATLPEPPPEVKERAASLRPLPDRTQQQKKSKL